MTRLLFWIALIILVVMAVRSKLRAMAARGYQPDGQGGRPPPGAGRAAPRVAESERMSSCAHCGLYFPASEAVHEGGRDYCSQAHARLPAASRFRLMAPCNTPLSAASRETFWRSLQTLTVTRIVIALVLLVYLSVDARPARSGRWPARPTPRPASPTWLAALLFAAVTHYWRHRFLWQLGGQILVDIGAISLLYLAAGGAAQRPRAALPVPAGRRGDPGAAGAGAVLGFARDPVPAGREHLADLPQRPRTRRCCRPGSPAPPSLRGAGGEPAGGAPDRPGRAGGKARRRPAGSSRRSTASWSTTSATASWWWGATASSSPAIRRRGACWAWTADGA
jgi:hypothetical protein